MNDKYSRVDKINSLLLKELAGLLSRERPEKEIEKKDIIISFTKVDTSKDLKHARVFFSVMPEAAKEETKNFLTKRSFGWQGILGNKLRLKYTPKLSFQFDEGHVNAMRVEEIIGKINRQIDK